MKKLTKVLAIAILISLTLIYIQPMALADEDATWNKIKDRGELRVGLSADYAPLEFEKTKMVKQSIFGVDIELAKKLLKIII